MQIFCSPGNLRLQNRKILYFGANLQNILDEVGGSMQNIVKMTTFFTHYNYIETFRSVRDAFFQEPYPANTLLFVESLALPDFMVEIEAVAVLD